MAAVGVPFLASWKEVRCSLGPGLSCVVSALPGRCRSGRVEAVEVTDRRAVAGDSLCSRRRGAASRTWAQSACRGHVRFDKEHPFCFRGSAGSCGFNINSTENPCICPTISHILRLSSFHCIIMAHCDRCNRWFSRTYALEQHKDTSRSHWPCHDCGIDYENHNALRQHYILSPNHYYCEDCDRLFTVEESRRQHMNDAHWFCRKHDRVRTPHHEITRRDLFSVSSHNRSLSLNTPSIHTINRARITISASFARRTL
jgi:transposase-like protein